MIAGIVEMLGPWTWWVVGLVLLCVEVLAPGTFFIWFGIAALIVGTVALLVDWGWQAEIILFVVLALLLAVAGRRYFGYGTIESEDSHLNERTARLQGRSFSLLEPIVEGRGRIRIDDTTWRVEGPDLPAGAKVRVVGAEGSVLRVEAEIA